MNWWITISGILAICLYIPLCIEIYRGCVKQNFATWILWAAIDGIAAAAIIAQHGNYILPAAFTIGGLITSLFILHSRNCSWSRFESLVTVLVIGCLIIWYQSGPWWATIASTTAMVIAGIPQIIDAYRKPEENSFLIWLGYLTANSLSLIGSKQWSVEETLYSILAGGLCIFLCLFTSKKFFMTGPRCHI